VVKHVELRRRRVALGQSQESLAAIIGISSRTIQRIEAGHNPSMVFQRMISSALDRLEKGKGMIK